MTWSRALRDDRGQSVALFALMLPLVFLMLLVTVDATHAFGQKRNLQTAADATAIASAYDLGHSGMVTNAGLAYSALNGGPPLSTTTPAGDGGPCPSQNPPNNISCYLTPVTYNGVSRPDLVEVFLHLTCAQTPTFFGGAVDFLTGSSAFNCTPSTVHSIGSLSSGGSPPAISFAALEHTAGCENHTLLVKLGGHLTVNNNIYVNSCSGHDAFDIFGGGSISAKDIFVNGGWEQHDTSKVNIPVTGSFCSPYADGSQQADSVNVGTYGEPPP